MFEQFYTLNQVHMKRKVILEELSTNLSEYFNTQGMAAEFTYK